MLFTRIELKGAYVIEPERLEDERGFFARSWDTEVFKKYGLNPKLVQCNISYSKYMGTLRGMHYQIPPFEEAKLVRCTKGSIYDVILDLRVNSPTFKKWFGINLTSANYKMIYIPEGFAHGFQTLEDNTEVFYQMSQFHNPDSERGIRWNDPAFNIKWPLEQKIISRKDNSWEFFNINTSLM